MAPKVCPYRTCGAAGPPPDRWTSGHLADNKWPGGLYKDPPVTTILGVAHLRTRRSVTVRLPGYQTDGRRYEIDSSGDTKRVGISVLEGSIIGFLVAALHSVRRRSEMSTLEARKFSVLTEPEEPSIAAGR